VPRAKADNGTPPDFGLSRELWTGRRSATSRQWSNTQACIDWKRYVKDKWVNQEERTLDPKWRDPAGHAQKGNNEERWQLVQSITGSQTFKIS